jgi:hypothetical protein
LLLKLQLLIAIEDGQDMAERVVQQHRHHF